MANATVSKYMAWVRAAVKDNQRLRKERKAFVETQDELCSELSLLKSQLDLQVQLANAAEAALNRNWQAIRSIPSKGSGSEISYLEGLLESFLVGGKANISASTILGSTIFSVTNRIYHLKQAQVDPLKSQPEPLKSGVWGDQVSE